MKRTLIAVAVLFFGLTVAGLAQKKATTVTSTTAPALEPKVRQLWQAFKNKDKVTLSALLDDDFRMFEEGLSAFGDKKAEVNAPDEFELLSYTLSDFTIKPIGPNAAVVTYIAQYEGKSAGEVSKGKSVFGEVWTRTGSQWKALYMQETYVK